jgi:hypothetical protein
MFLRSVGRLFQLSIRLYIFITTSVRTSIPTKGYRIWRKRYQNIQPPIIGNIDGCCGLESNLSFRCYLVSSKYVVTTVIWTETIVLKIIYIYIYICNM